MSVCPMSICLFACMSVMVSVGLFYDNYIFRISLNLLNFTYFRNVTNGGLVDLLNRCSRLEHLDITGTVHLLQVQETIKIVKI